MGDPIEVSISDITVFDISSLSTRTPSQSNIIRSVDKLFSLKPVVISIRQKVYEAVAFDVNDLSVLCYFHI